MTEQDRWQQIEQEIRNLLLADLCCDEESTAYGDLDTWLTALRRIHDSAVRTLEIDRRNLTSEMQREVNALCKERDDARAERDDVRQNYEIVLDALSDAVDRENGLIDERDAARQEVERCKMYMRSRFP